MNLTGLWNRYDQTIWIRAFGTIITTVTSFAIRPFLALYLYGKTGNIYLLGVILGLSPLMGLVTNIVAGGLADKYGRKPLLVYSLIFQGISTFGYIFASTALHFCIISIINGMASALYYPAANAQIVDIVPGAQRLEVFALMHTALNVGAAAGPMLGLLMVKISHNFVFVASAVSLLLYAALVYALIPETLEKANRQKEKNAAKSNRTGSDHVPALSPSRRMRFAEHKLLFALLVLSLPISLLYAQVESNFPLYLQQSFTNYLMIFSSLMTLNGTIVVFSAVWLAKKSEKYYLPHVLWAGFILFALVGVGYGFGPYLHTVAFLLPAEIIFTVGECITFPNQNKLISYIAPEDMRGRYFAIFNMRNNISRAIGPLLGGLMFSHFGGLPLFLSISGLLLVGGFFTHRLTRSIIPAGESAALTTSR
ncbi:multidrug resistance protein MdtH [Peptococcaceae bacterium CEB3]|nr:multidrug resistance protein MdtH [Peptococcaceae bacterium CEB3]